MPCCIFFQNVNYTVDHITCNIFRTCPFPTVMENMNISWNFNVIYVIFFVNDGKWNSHVFLCSAVLYHCDNTSILLFLYWLILFIASRSECVSVKFLQTLLWTIAWVTHLLADCIGSNWNIHTSCPKKASIHTEWHTQTCRMVNWVFAAHSGILTDHYYVYYEPTVFHIKSNSKWYTMSIPKRYSTHFLMLVMGKKSSAAFSICCKIGRAACSTVHTAVVPALLAPHSLTLLISSLVSDVVHNDVEFICSHCNFQKPNTLETQAVCVYLTNPGCIFLNRCHGNGLWLYRDTPEMKRKMLMCALLNREKQIQITTSKSELGGLSHLAPHWCHVFFVPLFIDR